MSLSTYVYNDFRELGAVIWNSVPTDFPAASLTVATFARKLKAWLDILFRLPFYSFYSGYTNMNFTTTTTATATAIIYYPRKECVMCHVISVNFRK